MDIKTLVRPIDSERATGRDLRADNSPSSLYHRIKDARTAARLQERKVTQSDDKNDLCKWRDVYDLAIEILSKHSKDLEVCAWLCEASLRLMGFPGLEASFNCTAKLINKYWHELFPFFEGDCLEDKVASFTGLNGNDTQGTLIAPISAVMITQGDTKGPYALWQYQQALEIANISDVSRRNKRLANGAILLSDIKTAISESTSIFYSQFRQDLSACIEAYRRLTESFEKKCGRQAPPSSQINEALLNFSEHLDFILSDRPNPQKIVQTQESIQYALPLKPDYSKIITREQALQTLDEVAKFFLNTEPHSPLPFLLQRAVRWGNMSFPLLLQELIHDENARNSVIKLTGIEIKH